MNTINSILGRNVKKYRALAGLNQTRLESKLFVNTQHISNIEKGRAFVSADLVQRLSLVFGIEPEELFFSGIDSQLLPGKLSAIKRELRRGIKETTERVCAAL